MDYSLNIRRAEIYDAHSIKEIMEEAFGKYKLTSGIVGQIDALEESIGDIENDIMSKYVFIALIDGKPVGSIRVAVNAVDKISYISRFGVRCGYSNIGVGKSLMNTADKLLIAQNISLVSLHTALNNTDLIRFYYGRGFHVESISVDRGYKRALLVKKFCKTE